MLINAATKFEQFTKFRNVTFESPEKVFFYSNLTYKLGNVSFLNTDITRVNFSDTCSFGEDKSENIIIEERELKKKFGNNKENSKDRKKMRIFYQE